MSITRQPPNTIWLGGRREEVGDLACSEAITPGMLVERVVSSGIKWRKHATAGALTAAAIKLDESMLNKGVDEASTAGDLIQVAIGEKGSTFWMLIASGANIAAGAKLDSAGNGKLRAVAGTALFTAVESVDNSAGPGDARIRVEVL